MDAPKALLIQDTTEYLFELENAVEPLLASLGDLRISKTAVLKWIIEEELEKIYHLYPFGHDRTAQPFARLHNAVNFALGGRLSILTKAYIQAPNLAEVEFRTIIVRLNHRDLAISYLGLQNQHYS